MTALKIVSSTPNLNGTQYVSQKAKLFQIFYPTETFAKQIVWHIILKLYKPNALWIEI